MAKRNNYNDVVIDVEGNALEGIEVTVYDSGTDDEATIYGQKSGGAALTQPFETGENGLIDFWYDPGAYRVELHDTELTPRVADREFEVSSPSGDDAGIDVSQIASPGSGEVLIGQADSVEGKALTGDVLVTAGGVTSVQPDTVGASELKNDEIAPVHLDTSRIKVRRVEKTTELDDGEDVNTTVNWPDPFANANYTVLVSIEANSVSRLYATITDRTAEGVDLNVLHLGGEPAVGYTIHLTAFKDT